MDNTLTSRTITALRLPLAIMVVFIHSFGEPKDYLINWNCLGSTDLYNIIRVYGSHVLPHIAVPTFFLISGYLFFVKMESTDRAFYKRQWSKRIHTLLVPYIIWNILSFLWSPLIMIMGSIIKGKPYSRVIEYFSDNLSLDVFWSFNNWGGVKRLYCSKLHNHTQALHLFLYGLCGN